MLLIIVIHPHRVVDQIILVLKRIEIVSTVEQTISDSVILVGWVLRIDKKTEKTNEKQFKFKDISNMQKSVLWVPVMSVCIQQ